ncbi:MAG: HAMP domain-containing protein [Rhodoferax sp.]|nr:HAMP domain-containing protein [Rhodoferax sp.]
MMPRRALSAKFFAIGLALLLLALLSIGLTMWVTRQLDGGAAAVNEAGRLRMQAWRLTSAVGGGRTPQEVAELVKLFDGTMLLLRDGDLQRPLAVPWNAQTRARFEALQQGWQVLRPAWQARVAPPVAELTAQVDGFVAQVDGLVQSIEETLARLTAVLNLFQFVMMVLAVAAAVLMMYVGYLFVIQPLQRIQQGLRQVQQGDFAVRLASDSADEFGDLAAGFNHMTATLQELYGSLERKVREKTRDLEAERQRLSALYEVSNFLVQAHTLEALAQGFAQKMRRVSEADAVAVRWSDEGTQRYLMLASDCLPEELVREERCLEAGLCACGQPQATAHTRVVPIISVDEQRLGNCARAGYDTLVSIPIRLQQRVLGEVDLFYRTRRSLRTEDRDLYDALNGHLANAVENLRSQALVREAAVSQERTLLARELHDSIAQSLSFLKIQVNLLRQAVERQDAAQLARVLDEMDAGVRESTQDVRELLLHFRTRTDNDDIEQALRTTLRKFEHQSGLRAQLSFHGHGVGLPQDVQLQVLHVVQEALSNVRKHARATEVQLDVFRDPHWVFRVRDNGRGFEPGAGLPDETHVGLQIMRERAQRIGARVDVVSTPGHGTEVCVALKD